MAIKFPTKGPRFATGQRLFALVNSALTFDAADYIPNLNNASGANYTGCSVNWDFGDGSVNLTATIASVATHKYQEPGSYIVTCQLISGGTDTAAIDVPQLVMSGQRDIEISINLTDITTTAFAPFIAAIHDTFRDEMSGQLRHALLILPKMSAVDTGGTPASSWGAADVVLNPVLSDAILAQAVDDAASRFQASYASGFGRMAFPTDNLEQAVWAEFGLDALAVGTSDEVASNMAAVENAWREIARGPGDGHRGVALAAAVAAATTAVQATTGPGAYGRLYQLPWATISGTSLTSGSSSVRAADVMRWLEYQNREIDDRMVLSTTLKTAQLRRLDRDYVAEVPDFDADTAWAWEIAQAAQEAVYSFYTAIDALNAQAGANMQNAAILVLGDPKTRNATIQIVDSTTKLWAMWQVGLVNAADGCPTLAQMAGRPGQVGGNYVGVRGVAVTSYAGSASVPATWDLRRLESMFSPDLRAATPVMGVPPAPSPMSSRKLPVFWRPSPRPTRRRARFVATRRRLLPRFMSPTSCAARFRSRRLTTNAAACGRMLRWRWLWGRGLGSSRPEMFTKVAAIVPVVAVRRRSTLETWRAMRDNNLNRLRKWLSLVLKPKCKCNDAWVRLAERRHKDSCSEQIAALF